MSLFSLVNIAEQKYEDKEDKIDNCTIVQKVDTEKLIISVSMKGVISIFNTSMQKKNLVLTQKLETNCICVSEFTQSSGKYLAILSSKALSFYSVEKDADHSYSLLSRNRHLNTHSLFQMQAGFQGYRSQSGGKQNQQMCVQSLDGMFFFQSLGKLEFKTQLPDLIIPVKFLQDEEQDLVMVASSNMNINCYDYTTMANSQVKADKATNPTDFKHELNGIRTNPKWSSHIGKNIQDIVQVNSKIMVTSMSQIQTLNKDTGDLESFQRVENEPVLTIPNDLFLMQVQEDNTLMIQKDNQAVWKAKLDHDIVDLQVVNLLEQRKLIMLICEDYIQLSVLGTAQKTNTLRDDILLDQKIDHEEFQNLWSNLEDLTKEKKSKSKGIKNLTFMGSHIEEFDKLEINQRAMELDTVRLVKDEKALDTIGIPIRILSGIADKPVTNLFVHAEDNNKFKICENSYQLEEVVKGGALNTQMFVFMSDEVESTTDEVNVKIRQSKDASQLAQGEQIVKLPPWLLMSPVSEGTTTCEFNFKVNIAITCDPGQIKNLQEYIAFIQKSPQIQDDSQFDFNKPIFQVGNGGYVQMNLSKSKMKLRIFSNSLEAMCYPLQFIQENMKDQLALKFEEAIPMQGIFDSIERFIRYRNKYNKLQDSIQKKQQQQVAFQKRILFRFKDKIPKDLNFMDKLFNLTHMQLRELVDEIQGLQTTLVSLFNSLKVRLRVVYWLALLKFNLETGFIKTLDSQMQFHNFFHECVEDLDNQLVVLLREQMAKNDKERNIQPTQGELFLNSEKIKKHLTIILDRMSKGYQCKKTE